MLQLASRDQRTMQVCDVDVDTGATTRRSRPTPSPTGSRRSAARPIDCPTAGSSRRLTSTTPGASSSATSWSRREFLQVAAVLNVGADGVVFSAIDRPDRAARCGTPISTARARVDHSARRAYGGTAARRCSSSRRLSLDIDGADTVVRARRRRDRADRVVRGAGAVRAQRRVCRRRDAASCAPRLVLPRGHVEGSATAAGADGPVRRAARAAGAASRNAYLNSQWLADQGLRGRHRRRPRHAWARAAVGRARSLTISHRSCSTTRSTPCTRSPPRIPTSTCRALRSEVGRSAATWPRSRCCGVPMCFMPRSRAHRSPTGGCTTPTTPSATSASTPPRSRTTRSRSSTSRHS